MNVNTENIQIENKIVNKRQERNMTTSLEAMNHMGHVTKFQLIFRNNSYPHEKRY